MNMPMVIVGGQWGDEGKGKIVNLLSEAADLVARYQGGHNAGHTVTLGSSRYALHLVPSGILAAGKLCVIGNGIVIDPEALEDNFTYRTILRGMQDALDLHLRAVVQSTRNEGLRRLFTDFFTREMDDYDSFLKYGKAKGWTQIPPSYAEPAI